MKHRIAVALLAIVLLPLAGLGWLGVRNAQHERALAEHRRLLSVSEQLKLIEGVLQGLFDSRRRSLLDAAQALEVSAEAIASHLKARPDVRQVFAMDSLGQRLHPAEPFSGSEADFMRRSAGIWRNREILWQGFDDGSTNRAPTSVEPTQSRSGWYVWFADAEQNHIFWWRDRQDRLIGFELDPARLLMALIAALPATPEDAATDSRSRLVMPDGVVLYQWGKHPIAASEPAQAVLPLSHPLVGWKLEAFGPPAARDGTEIVGLLAGLLAVGSAVGGLAFYLYREQRRESLLAQQRVSFVNQVSHELKTPLTNIRLYAELLDDEIDAEDGKQKRYVEVIAAESRRLSRLITNVLNFARLQKERLTPRPQPTAVDDVIEATLAAFAPLFEAKGIRVVWRGSDPTQVALDGEVLEQILNNLLSNVEKYAAAGGRVEITSAQEGAFSVVRVRDFGPGIPAAEGERIFEPFYRVRSDLNEGATGTGIGLTLARELARLHGGDLTLVPGSGGACFEIRLRTA